MPTSYVLMGVRLQEDNATPFGDLVRRIVHRTDGTRTTTWLCSPETYTAIRAQSQGMVQSVVSMIREAERRGDAVVTGVVSRNTRAGVPSSPPRRRANLDDLSDRAKGLVMQMAGLLDAGPIPPGTLQELSKSYASLQAEMDEVRAQLETIDSHLSMMRGVIIESVMSDG